MRYLIFVNEQQLDTSKFIHYAFQKAKYYKLLYPNANVKVVDTLLQETLNI